MGSVDIKSMMFGLVFITMLFIALNLAFNSPLKSYMSEDDLDSLESLGKQYVGEAKPSFFGQVYFFVNSFWTIIKTTFNLLTFGLNKMIYDVAGIIGIPTIITSLFVGVLIYIIAIEVLDKLRGAK